MPNRIIKESICTSEEIDKLSDKAENFFYRLMVNADDFGLFDARPVIIKARCYPLKSIDINCIQLLLSELQQIGLIKLYSYEDKPYLAITTWSKHQQIRAKRAKFPTFEMGTEIICNQLISDASNCTRNPIQSNPIQSNRTKEKITLSRDGNFENIKHHLEVWENAYQNIDIERELKKAAAWCLSNPKKAPKSDYARFINSWLSRQTSDDNNDDIFAGAI